MDIFSWEFRKPYIGLAVDTFCNFVTTLFRGDEELAGWIVTLFLHNIPYSMLLFNIFLYPLQMWMIVGFVVTYVSNIFFRGCICFKIERQLFNDKKWYGPYGLLEYVGLKVNTPNVVWFFGIWTKAMFIMIILKALRSYFNLF
jgi:hypothetical protein